MSEKEVKTMADPVAVIIERETAEKIFEALTSAPSGLSAEVVQELTLSLGITLEREFFGTRD